jgi:hypothetical protein
MNGLIRKLVRTLGVKWLTGQVRAAAEGKLGPKWQGLYWWFAGRKRTISTFLFVAAGAAAMLGYVQFAAGLAVVASIGISLGFVDANWRDDATDDWLKDSRLWKLLAANAPIITAGAATGLAWLQGSDCSIAEWCSRGSIALSVVMAVAVQVGLVDAAWNAPAPEPPPEE